VQCRGHEKKQRFFRGEFCAAEIPGTKKLAAGIMPFHARPVVQSLQRQVNVFISFELHNRQPPLGVFGLCQVKGDGAVFKHHGACGLAEKILHGAS